MTTQPGRTAPTTDLGRYVLVCCPACASRWLEIVHDQEVDQHLTRCTGCGSVLILKRWRDLD